MATFDTNISTVGHITDHVTGENVKNIMKQYLNQPITEELGDKIMKHLQEVYGKNHPIQVNLDDETNDIEIILKDRNGKYMKCSSLKLFPKESA